MRVIYDLTSPIQNAPRTPERVSRDASQEPDSPTAPAYSPDRPTTTAYSPTTPAYSPTTPAYSPTPPYREPDECKETQPAPTATSSASEEHKSSWTDEDTRQAVDSYFARRESGVSSSDTFAGATSIETWVEAANTLLSVVADQTSCSDVTLSTSK